MIRPAWPDNSIGVLPFGPRPEKRMEWNKKGTSTDWGAYPEHDSLMSDYTYAEWTQKQLQKKD